MTYYYFIKTRCDCTHNGNEVLNVKLSIQIDRLFTLLFTDSEFSKELRQHRRITNFTETPWSTESNIGLRVRYTTSTFPLDYFIGPKSTVVKETQVVQPCSVPGHLYAINIEAVCHGTPFADAYCNQTHYCLRSVTAYETHVVVFSRLYYFKSLPGILKSNFYKRECDILSFPRWPKTGVIWTWIVVLLGSILIIWTCFSEEFFL